MLFSKLYRNVVERKIEMFFNGHWNRVMLNFEISSLIVKIL